MSADESLNTSPPASLISGSPADGTRTRTPFPRHAAARARAAREQARYERGAPSGLDETFVHDEALAEVAQRERIYRWLLAAADAIAAAGSVLLAMSVLGTDGLRPEFLVVVPLIILAAKVQGLYDHDELVLNKSTLDEFPRLVNLATLFALLAWLTRHLIVVGVPGTMNLFALWLLLIATLTAARGAARAIAKRATAVERCLLVGSSMIENRLKSKFAETEHIDLVGLISVDAAARDSGALLRAASKHRAHRVVIALSDHADPELTMDVLRGAAASGLRVSLLPSSIGAVGSSVAFDDLGGIPLLGVPKFGLSRSSRAIKRAFDLAGASFALLLAAPLMAVIALAIRLKSPGPILFKQTRVGRDDRHFKMVKFRTMVEGADAMKLGLLEHNEASGLFKMRHDPRVTPIGRLLRRTCLDELPQLFNVLRGDMSIVGPRPLVIDEDERVTGYDRRRLHLTPGMTGRWQILGSSRIPLSEMVKIDYLYVANWSLWADFKILLQTVGYVVGRRGM